MATCAISSRITCSTPTGVNCIAGRTSCPITPQVFDLLDYLIRNRERVVSKDDLISAIWNGRIVSDAALTTRLNAARSAIGDSGEEQRLIKTLPRKGFRFVGTGAGGAGVRRRADSRRPDGIAGSQPSRSPINPQSPCCLSRTSVTIRSRSISPTAWWKKSRRRCRSFVAVRHRTQFEFYLQRWAVDIKQVGRELGVRYVLEGSVRKAGNRIRIAGQLIDAETGAHLWADRFDGALEDIFDLQDKVTSSVVGAIAPMLQRKEIRRARRKPTENFGAYDYYLRGLASSSVDPGCEQRSAPALLKAISNRPRYLACAYGMAAWCYIQRKARGWMIDEVQENSEATRLAWKAVHLGADDPVALCMGAYVLAFIAREFDDAMAFVDRGLAINPKLVHGLESWCLVRIFRGEGT